MAEADVGELEDWLQLAIGLVGLAIFALALVAYRRRPTTRTLLVTCAFGLYAVRSVFLVADFVLAEAAADLLESVAIFLEGGFLALLVAAFLKD